MRRRLAFLVYLVGLILVLGTIISGFSDVDEHLWNWADPLLSLLRALIVWWVTAGIGIRLGVFPIEFFRNVARSLGLGYEAPVEDATRVPPRPEPPQVPRP